MNFRHQADACSLDSLLRDQIATFHFTLEVETECLAMLLDVVSNEELKNYLCDQVLLSHYQLSMLKHVFAHIECVSTTVSSPRMRQWRQQCAERVTIFKSGTSIDLAVLEDVGHLATHKISSLRCIQVLARRLSFRVIDKISTEMLDMQTAAFTDLTRLRQSMMQHIAS